MTYEGTVIQWTIDFSPETRKAGRNDYIQRAENKPNLTKSSKFEKHNKKLR